MANFLEIESDFLDKIIMLIEEHMADENFGVAELAEKAGMSRSNLLRRVQKLAGYSVSVLIRKVRLHRAKGLLTSDSLNVSEVAFEVGFNSASYFIRCFREEYGYPPGEEFQRQQTVKAVSEEAKEELPRPQEEKPKFLKYLLPVAAAVLLTIMAAWLIMGRQDVPDQLEKSIAVLPFKNNSSDSSNLYIINGLMESILNNLQKIEELQVVSRTSVEPYRITNKTIPEISEELGVSYFIEGSGQKVGDQIQLSINLVQADNDNNLWSGQYNRQVIDIFELQADVAQDIAREISVVVSPEVQKRIAKVPTENLEAYDLYLRGVELSNLETLEGLERALIFFDEAIIKDPSFPHPYAFTAICYYYLDVFKANKEYSDRILDFADRALELDNELPQAYIAKGLYFMQTKRYKEAVEVLQKVFLYNPNSAQANNYLSEIYNFHLPDTEQYLRYALRGTQLEVNKYDSTAATFSYLHLANALMQTGFIKEAEENILLSLAYDSTNTFSQYVYAYILLAKDKDAERSRDMMVKTYRQDTTRIDVLQELGKLSYFMGDTLGAYEYYHDFATRRNTLGLYIYPNEDILVGMAYENMGYDSLANYYYEKYRAYGEVDSTKYKNLFRASYHALMDNKEEAIEALKEFANEKHIQYWFVWSVESDPILRRVSDHPEYDAIVKRISENFWAEHEEVKLRLKEAGLF